MIVKKALLWIAPIVLAALAASCAHAEPAPEPKQQEEARYRIDFVQIPAPSLAGNRMGNPIEQPALVFMPPDIREGERLPVLYYFHGNLQNYLNFHSIGWALLKEMQEGTLARFIMVSVNGACKDRGGSFWVNSPVTGDWEDFVVRDLIPWVDANYPTIARSEARGLLGFSMGGFAALNLGLAHADLFGSIFAVSPPTFDETGLRDAMLSWDEVKRDNYGRAFSPGPGTAGQIPSMTEDLEDRAIQDRWKAGLGGFELRIASYLAGEARLQGIRIDWGSSDTPSFIRRCSPRLVAVMKDAGLPIFGAEHLRGHEFNLEIARKQAIPFFLALWGLE